MGQRQKRILWVTNGLPYPPHSGFRLHDFHLIQQASQHYSIILCCLLEFAEEARYIDEMKRYCEDVHVVLAQARSFGEHLKAMIRSILSGRPLATRSFYYEALADKIRHIAATQNIDLFQIEHSFRTIPQLSAGAEFLQNSPVAS
ncbi:MAG: hypothetical protein GY801_46670 [bacterium]|nr:hypothetical protein [bacterium]